MSGSFSPTTNQRAMPVAGTYTYLDAGGTQEIMELTPPNSQRWKLESLFLDLSNMTQDGTIDISYKVDVSNYRVFKSIDFTVATDPDGLLVSDIPFAIASSLKVEYTEGADEGANRDIPHEVVYSILN